MVEGLLAGGCTVVVPTFSWGYAILPPTDMRPARNGWDYKSPPAPTPGEGRIYSPDTTEIDPDMGAIIAEAGSASATGASRRLARDRDSLLCRRKARNDRTPLTNGRLDAIVRVP